LVLAGFLVFSNSWNHTFHLDSAHTVESNSSIRSLANIPSFFINPGTFTSLRSNVNYRPLLTTSYALNYALCGHSMWGWHLVQILLHVWCAWWIFLFARFLMTTRQGWERDLPALGIALVFVVHPTQSGVVNYISARSSLLSSAFLLPSVYLYLQILKSSATRFLLPVSFLLFLLALLSKGTSVACLAQFFFIEVWKTAETKQAPASFLQDLRSTLTAPFFRRFGPFLVGTILYLVLRSWLMSPYQVELVRAPGTTGSLDYLRTQFVVWWVYVGKWFAPVNLVADNATFPVYRSLSEGPVALSLAAWILFAFSVILRWKKNPRELFLAASALALLSPSSSIVPLSEMLNEHRPYLPLGLLSLVWLLPLGEELVTHVRGRLLPGLLLGGIFLGLLGAWSTMTYRRNLVFLTGESYWKDVVRKAPAARSFNNLGLVYMAEGQLETAKKLFSKSIAVAPNWYVSQTNLAIIFLTQGKLKEALPIFNRAVSLDHFSGIALRYRGEFHLANKDYAKALTDFRAARSKSLEHFPIAIGLATSYAGLAKAPECHNEFLRCLELDRVKTFGSVVPILQPFFLDTVRASAGVQFLQLLSHDLPNEWWVHENLGYLLNRLGKREPATASLERSRRLRGQ
jgi:hypothetical protein